MYRIHHALTLFHVQILRLQSVLDTTRWALFQVTATDGDTGVNQLVTYSLSDVSNNGLSLFSVSSTGTVSVVGSISRGALYTLVVRASDNPSIGEAR